MKIGTILKKIRLDKNYTIADVTCRASMSISLLSQIENNKITPSLQTLEELLRFYSVNFSDFFKQVEQKKYVFVKQADIEVLENNEHGFKLKLLASKLQNNSLESFIVELNAGSEILAAVHDKEINTERIIYGMSGIIEVLLEKEKIFIIESGDSLNFKSYISCVIKNLSEEKASFLISGTQPVFI
jgi:transcriptional regulator with XRE-family HTH domain